MTKNPKTIALIISIVLFAVSLTQPAYYIDATEHDAWANSFYLLIFGWSGVFAGGAAFAWLANPFILLSWFFLYRRIKAALVLSAIATAFAASFLCFHVIISSEAPTYSVITSRKAGYWLWLLSISWFFISTTIIYYREKISGEKIN